MTHHTVCPECGLVWSIEEIEDQTCDYCGWPDPYPEEDDEDDYDPTDKMLEDDEARRRYEDLKSTDDSL